MVFLMGCGKLGPDAWLLLGGDQGEELPIINISFFYLL